MDIYVLLNDIETAVITRVGLIIAGASLLMSHAEIALFAMSWSLSISQESSKDATEHSGSHSAAGTNIVMSILGVVSANIGNGGSGGSGDGRGGSGVWYTAVGGGCPM